MWSTWASIRGGRRKRKSPGASRSQNRLRNRVKAERRLPAAQIYDRAFQRAQVRDDGPRARCAQLGFELSAGVAAADKADRRHSSAWEDGRISCLVQLLADVLDALGD